MRAASLFGEPPGVTVRVGDARQVLRREPTQYDVIVAEPPPPGAAGVVNLYSREFYRLCRQRLRPGGRLVQWWPLSALDDAGNRSLVRAMVTEFPCVTAWTPEFHEVLLMGSVEPQSGAVTGSFGPVAGLLREVGIESEAELLATFLAGDAALRRFAGQARPVTDDWPWLEVAPQARKADWLRGLAAAHGLREGPLGPERQALWDGYSAVRLAYEGRLEEAGFALAALVHENPSNLYYRALLP